MNDDYVGTWRITEMELWDQDFIDLVKPGQIIVYEDGRGSFNFGAVELDIDCTPVRSGKQSRIGFTFQGFDEGDEVSGKGWLKLHGDVLKGEIHFHLGDKSWFKARKMD
jgi:hypothetical protein